MNKVLIIGLDGGTWKILSPMMEKGKMPNLKRMTDQGASGTLRSTIPPMTAAAWSSFQTGVNPGKHGIIDFRSFDPDTKRIRLVNSSDININTIWELAGKAGKRIISVNVPVTYPPKEVDGIIIGGMLSPKIDKGFVYPQEVFDKFIRHSGYRITSGRLEKQALMSIEAFIDEQIAVEKERFRLCRRLMERYEWDLCMVHNQMMDRIQHAFYPYLDSRSKDYNEGKFNIISRFYEETDKLIGELAEGLEKDTSVFVISDHGFSEVSAYVNLNAWLGDNGYLSFTLGRVLGNIMTAIGKSDSLNITKKIIAKLVKRPAAVAEITGKKALSLIRWDKTRAYTVNGVIWGNIYLGDKSIGGEIISALRKWRDPVGKKHVVKNIYRREEIFQGPCLEKMPDLFIEPNEGYFFHTPMIKDMKIFHRPALRRFERVGSHDQEGIFVASGENIKHIRNMDAHITDMAPTVLSMLGAPIPAYMDGKVPSHLFIKKPVEEFVNTAFLRDRHLKEYQEQEKCKIESRLRDLGYL